MFLPLLTLALAGASGILSAPVRPSPFTSEPTEVTVMVTSTTTFGPLASNIDANLEARQWEWTPSPSAWTEPTWTQPAWSDPAVAPIPTEPVWTPSVSYSYTEASVPSSTPTYSWEETHRPDPKDALIGGIIAGSVFGGFFVVAIIGFLYTMIRRHFYRSSLPQPPHDSSDLETNVGLHRNSEASALDTSCETLANKDMESDNGFHSTPTRGHDVSASPQLADPLDRSVPGLRRPSPVYENNIPPQETHWPHEEAEQQATWTRGVGFRES